MSTDKKYTIDNHCHEYFINEESKDECTVCGLLKSTIESSPKSIDSKECTCHCHKSDIPHDETQCIGTCPHCSDTTEGDSEDALKFLEEHVASQTYLDELWFNARNGGKENTQLVMWDKDLWKKAAQMYIDNLIKAERDTAYLDGAEFVNKQRRENPLYKQIDKLGVYLMEEYPEEIIGGGAVDVAIKILSKLKEKHG